MFFICFSHIERYIVAQSLAYHLKNYGFKVWYDYDELFIGDNGDFLNFEEGIYKADYIIIIVSEALFKSPCAIIELEKITELYDSKEITVLPILYNITSSELPAQFSWINELIYAEISNESGTLNIATQICAKYFEDIVRNNHYIHIEEIHSARNINNHFLRQLIDCYIQTDNNNINARATLLYILNLYLKDLDTTSIAPEHCYKGINYLYKNTTLNIPVNFKELSIMENSIIILLNIMLTI